MGDPSDWIAMVSTVIAVASCGIAWLSFDQARKARQIAQEANEISMDANKESKLANELVRTQMERETEHHDVRWEGKFIPPRTYRIINKGEDSACNVQAWATCTNSTFDDEARQKEVDRVNPGDWIDFHFTYVEIDYSSAVREISKARENISKLAEVDWTEDKRKVYSKHKWTLSLFATLGLDWNALDNVELYRNAHSKLEKKIKDLQSGTTSLVQEKVRWKSERGQPHSQSWGPGAKSLGELP